MKKLFLLLAASLICSAQTGNVTNLWLETLNVGEESIRDMVYSGGFVWAVTQTAPAKLIKMDVTNPSAWTTVTFAADGKHNNAISVVPEGSKIYVLFASNTAIYVSSVDASTSVVVDVIADTGFSCGNGAMESDGTNLYVVTYGTVSVLPQPAYAQAVKYRISDFARLASATIQTGVYNAWSVSYDSGKLYIGGADQTPSAWFARLDSNLTVEQFFRAPLAYVQAGHRMALTSSYVWSSLEQGGGNVLRMLKTDLSSFTAIPTGLINFMENAFSAGGYIWSCNTTIPNSSLARIHATTLGVEIFNFTASQGGCQVVGGDSSNLYFAFYSSPSKISAATLASFNPSPPLSPTTSTVSGKFVAGGKGRIHQ